MSGYRNLETRVKELEDWKKSVIQCIPDWQKIGEVLGLPVGTDVPKQLLVEIYRLKNEIEMWKMQAKAMQYGIHCACGWEDGKVVSLCGAHSEVIRKVETRLAEKYRKLTEPSKIQTDPERTCP